MRGRITALAALLLTCGGFLTLGNIASQEKPEKLMLKAVYVMFPDNSVKHISPTPGEGFYATACIHPEGKAVVFSGGARGYSRVWKYDFTKKKTVPITPDSFVSTLPSYSWDGSLIVFSADRDLDQKRYDMYEIGRSIEAGYGFIGGKPENLNLYIIDSEGSGIRQITRGKYQDTRPAFSPDGKLVVFRSNRGGETDGWPRMWIVPSDGSEKPKPLLSDTWCGRPWYSVDGKLIYFFTDVKGRHTLCKMPSNGGKWKPLSNDTVGSSSHGPYVDLDGQYLWYHCKVDDLWGVYKLPLDGGDPVRFIPPGFEDAQIAHATRARNGCIAFDSNVFIQLPQKD
jgi:Tol biopolymer transport system component